MNDNRLRHSLLLTAPGQLEWVAEELPALQTREILVRTLATASSLGTELPQYTGTARSRAPLTFPRMTGYESYAEVLHVGPGVQQWCSSDHLVASYGYRTHAILPAQGPVPVLEHIPSALALLAILSCDVAKGIRKLHLHPEEPVLVTGGGAIGLLTVFVLRAYGIAAVDLVEPLPERRQLALDLGARRAFTPVDRIDADYPAGIECSSRASAFQFLQQHLRDQGRIAVLADGNLEPLVLAPEFHSRELQIVGSSDGWDYHAHAAWFFALPHLDSLTALFDLVIQPADLPASFAALASGQLTAIKILTQGWSDFVPIRP